MAAHCGGGDDYVSEVAMTSLEDVRLNRARDRIFEAVEDAIAAGMTPEEFKRLALEAWAEACRLSATKAAVVLSR